MPKEKKVKKNDIKTDELNSEELADETDVITNDDMGSPTYEELVDINQELEKSVLRANADLDNALKKISSRDKKLIVCLGSLYNIGNILNKN